MISTLSTPRALLVAALFLGTAACVPSEPPAPSEPAPVTASAAGAMSPLQAQLSGKTLTNEFVTMALTKDGQIIGKESTGEVTRGTWTVRDGQFCRTLTEPAAYAGTACQDVAFSGNQVTFTRANGSTITYTMS